jgi:hypothetical protein
VEDLERALASPPKASARRALAPLVVQYLYVHGRDEPFEYPSSRVRSGRPERLVVRYLECVLVQAASLRLRAADCELALVTNLTGTTRLGTAGERLLDRIHQLGVTIVPAQYLHAPARATVKFASSRYVFDAICATARREEPERPLWLLDVDCVWVDPGRAFASFPSPGEIGCVEIPYPLDWTHGPSRPMIAALARRLGAPAGPPPPWIGGELLAGRASDLLDLVDTCDRLDAELADSGEHLATEEQLLSLASALGRIETRTMMDVASRIWTGPRHGAPAPTDPGALSIWHLPSEKGLGFRRTARELARSGSGGLLHDLEDPQRAMRRFNVAGAGRRRRVRDDLWLAGRRAAEAVGSLLPSGL